MSNAEPAVVHDHIHQGTEEEVDLLRVAASIVKEVVNVIAIGDPELVRFALLALRRVEASVTWISLKKLVATRLKARGGPEHDTEPPAPPSGPSRMES
ncbi:MAG TPA: hypothetical protein VM690_05730 [Gaiellaceae bacterium]|nr:hypothetical protein [Gaiellaceae bacterium]